MSDNAGCPLQVPSLKYAEVSLADHSHKGTTPNPGQHGSTLYKVASTPGGARSLQLLQNGAAPAEVLAVLPPFPMTLPAAKDGTLM